MRILALADVESKYYWDYFEKSKLDNIDLIISAGDLESEYLEFIATYAKVPVLYVHGNHDTDYDTRPPLGCTCIDDDVFEYKGFRIMGLGGSMSYNNGKHQYTESEMGWRIKKLRMKRKLYKGIDILVTHSPARGLNDGDDMPHRGFECFRRLLDKYQPKLFIHGHVHLSYGRQFKREDKYNDTRVINAFEKIIIEI